MDSENTQTIANSLKPTFENVTRDFITGTLHEILFSDELPNFKFDFREDEAIKFIEKVLQDYSNTYDFLKEKSQKILQQIKEKSDKNTLEPVMIVNDYKKFFELLRQFYERDIELYFLRTHNSGFPVYEKDNCFEQIWLRATPDDFNNPERFLSKQVDMIKDTTFAKYDEETFLGKLSFLDNNILCVKNGIARTWDENSREIEMTIYDKKYYNDTKLFDRPHYTLPVIRYGIYEKNGKKICYIGSIQNKNKDYEESDLKKKVNRSKYKINANIPEEDISQVEPKNILALSIFINLLHREGISEIEIPGMYVLDYEYHEKRNKKLLEDFKKWTKEEIDEYPEDYKRCSYYFERNYKKEDVISQIKTEKLSLTLRRLLCHYPNGNIQSYPYEVDSFLHLNIPIVKDENEINGNVLKELYNLVKEKSSENER